MTREWINDGRNKHNQRFCGIDGEGGNIADPDALWGEVHRYLLLRAGDQVVENPEGLSFQECAEFLCNLPRKRIYSAYFFDYDVTMILRGIPEERAKRLMDRGARQKDGGFNPLPVDYAGYQFDYMPHKEFRIRREDQKEWLIISDAGQFFQSSFLRTLEKWQIGTQEERDFIAKGKSMRGDFHMMDEEIKAYNALEILLHEQLMETFRSVCVDTGYVPRKWQGPGYLASAMLEHHGVPRRKDIPIMQNFDFRYLANEAYYGGRFETTAAGPISGPVYQYDINSAYPSILRTLPCLIHGSWRRIRNMPDRGHLWFGQVYFHHDAGRLLCNLPVRSKNGNISYPREGNGVYWSTELEAAQEAGTHVTFTTGWIYEPHCDCRWFDFIDEYYAMRVALGKTNKGYVLKLAGNSLYGKIAQSIGYAPYANPVWAGLITAGCRAMLIDAYKNNMNDVYMLATDGIFCAAELDVPVSTELGEWERTVHDDGIFIVQPGIYYLPHGDVKTRGVERGRINNQREAFESAWQRFLDSHGEDHTVSVAVSNFITIKQALSRRKWRLAGTWENTTRDISFDWSSKRQRSLALRDERGTLRTLPHDGDRKLMSTGYDRVIGGHAKPSNLFQRFNDPGLLEKERMEEQPDWVEPLISELSLSNRYVLKSCRVILSEHDNNDTSKRLAGRYACNRRERRRCLDRSVLHTVPQRLCFQDEGKEDDSLPQRS